MAANEQMSVINQLIEKYVTQRRELDENVEPAYRTLSKEVDTLSVQLCQALAAANMTSVRHKDHGTFIASFRGPYVGVRKIPGTKENDDQAWDELVAFCQKETDEAGHPLIDFIFKYAPIPQRLSAEYKRRAETGDPLLPGVEAYTVESISWKKNP
jgi:hypothetical protein